MSRPRSLAVAVLGLAALVLAGAAGAGPAANAATAAATGGATQAGGRLDFVGQTPWVGANGLFGLRLKVTRPSGPSNLEVAVTVYPAVAFRSEFQETLAGRIFGDPVLPEKVFPLGSITAEPNGDYVMTTPATLGGRDGVHPVRVELRDRDDLEVVDDLVTHLVYLAGEHPGPKLGVSIVVPVHAPPALQPDGTRARPSDAQLAGLSLAIDSARALPVSFVPTPETVAALVASNDPRAGAVLTSLRQADDRFVVGGPYVPVSLPVLTGTGLDGEVARQLNRGTTTLTEVLRGEPAGHLWVAEEPLDAASVDVLAARGVGRVVATEAGLTPIPDQLITLTGPFQLEGERSSVDGAAADSGLSAHFDGGGNPALQAAHLLADLAVLYLDLPGEVRGVVALAPRTWQPDRVFLDTVVAGLAAHPAVEAIGLDALFTNVPPATDLGEPLVRRPAVDPGGSLTGVVEGIRAARARLDSLGSVLGPTNAVSGDLDERLLVAQSADFRTARQRNPYLAGVRDAVDDQIGGIVMPQDRSITLTARRGEIPVTFQNHTGHPVRVTVRMESDKLDFPRGETLELDLTRLNTTHRFPVVARTTGAFPIRITLESPDGRLVVGRARLTVRSTAASGVGLAISVGAALFLALWWGRHAQRGRRARRLMEPSAILAPRGPSGPGPFPTPDVADTWQPSPVLPPAGPDAVPAAAAAPGHAPAARTVPARVAAPGATVLAVPLVPDPPRAVPVPHPLDPIDNPSSNSPSNNSPSNNSPTSNSAGDVESAPVPAPGTLGGG